METDPTVEMLIRTLGLEGLPTEGGLYRQTWASADIGAGGHPAGTAIYYLLTDAPDSFSAFHRLPAEEVFHFYLGDPLETTLLYPDGSSQQIIMGQDLAAGQHVQFVVPRGVWQGSRVAPGGRFSLIGTTMAPGFLFSDYESADRDALLAQYPQERERILAMWGHAAR